MVGMPDPTMRDDAAGDAVRDPAFMAANALGTSCAQPCGNPECTPTPRNTSGYACASVTAIAPPSAPAAINRPGAIFVFTDSATVATANAQAAGCAASGARAGP